MAPFRFRAPQKGTPTETKRRNKSDRQSSGLAISHLSGVLHAQPKSCCATKLGATFASLIQPHHRIKLNAIRTRAVLGLGASRLYSLTSVYYSPCSLEWQIICHSSYPMATNNLASPLACAKLIVNLNQLLQQSAATMNVISILSQCV